MKCLIVVAHPLKDSLCHHLASQTIQHLKDKGYSVTVKDLYKEGFDPVLTQEERKSYYAKTFDASLLADEIRQLQETESLVFIFPTWWFGFPAILKGWFDRVWAPGYAYKHASDLTALTPNLNNLKEIRVVTTLGAAWWVDYFVLRRPVKRVIKSAIAGACARGFDFKMLSLYSSESLTRPKVDKFIDKIKGSF